MPAEIELKLAIDPAAIAALLRHPALLAAKAGRARRERLRSTYFDAPAFPLAERGVGLRLREEPRRWVQAAKGPPLPETSGALVARDEHEWVLHDGKLDPALLATTPWAPLLARVVGSEGFGPRFVTDYERRTIPLRLGAATRALLCVDRGVIVTADGRRQREISEIEIELVNGDPIELFVLAAALAADLPLSMVLAGKAARGVALVRGRADGWDAPVRAEAIAFPKEATVAAALTATLRECVRQIAANAPGLLADADPEWVHQMRIGTRRLRACLGLVAPLLPPRGIEPLIAEVRWLAGALGAVRDIDVFAGSTLNPLAQALSGDPAEPALARLRDAAIAEQHRVRQAARRAVASARCTRLLLAAAALAMASDFGAAPATAGSGGLDERMAKFAARHLQQRHARLLRRVHKSRGAEAEELHAVRIATKKMRYAAEFFAGAFSPARRVRAFVAALAGIQDALGQQNDAIVAVRLARELAGDDPALAVGAGSVSAWVAARRETRDAAFRAAARCYRKARPFWHDG